MSPKYKISAAKKNPQRVIKVRLFNRKSLSKHLILQCVFTQEIFSVEEKRNH